jgi:glycosyltransferase involved in cell wall biosynthesis
MHNIKKLLIFIPSIEDGGVEKNLYIITNYLSNYIENINIITFDTDKKKKFNDKVNFICPNFISQKNFGRHFKYFFCLILLVKIILNNKKNCVVFSWQANIYSIIICYFFRIKIISRSNSSPSGWSKNIFKNFIFKFFLKKADTLIVNSILFKKEIDKKFHVRSKLILNPFDFSFIKKKSNEKINNLLFKNKKLKILNIGRFTDQKDQITLIKAAKLALKIINLKLFIIGKGVLEESMKKYIKNNNLSKHIHIIGYKENPFKYIKKSDVFVLTSKFEGSPNVLVECQILKKYIISTDCPTGPREILQNGNLGSLVKIGDYKSIAKILINFNKKKNIKKINKAYNLAKKYDYKRNCLLYLREVQKYL